MTPDIVPYHMDQGVQVYTIPGHKGKWLSDLLHCPHCAHEWPAIAPRGFIGVECPMCEYADPMYVWSADEINDDQTP